MPRGNYFEFIKEEDDSKRKEKKTKQSNATLQIINIIYVAEMVGE